MSSLKKIITSLVLTAIVFSVSPAMALTFTEVVNLLQAPDINLPTGVTNPKGNIGFILSNLFWGTGDGVKNGKIKPEYLDYSGISSWTQSGTITYLTASTGSVGIGTLNPGGYATAIRGSDDTSGTGALWVSGLTTTTPGLMVRNDGNVGIGTASPERALHIWSPINTVGARVTVNVSNGIGSPYTPLEIEARNDVDMIDGFGPRINFYASDNTANLQSLGAIGIVRSGADNTGDIVFRPSTTGTENERMRILSNGNVGIGTSNPVMKLQVVPNVNQYGLGIIGNNTVGQSYGGYIMAGTNSSDSAFRVVNQAQNAEYMYIRGDGNIGIGTTSPGEKLQVAGGDIIVHSNAATNTYALRLRGDAATGYGQISGNTSYGLVLQKDGGNVGIGTVSPISKLDVYSNVGNPAISIRAGDAIAYSFLNMYAYNALSFQMQSASWGNYYGAPSHVFRNLAGTTDYMTIASTGYVGIGVTAPTYRLQLPNTASVAGQGQANAWVTYSDGRVKTDKKNIGYGISEIMKIEPKQYFHHSSEFQSGSLIVGSEGRHTIGFIAQDLQKVIPEAVNKPKNDSKELWSVDHNKLVPVLVNAMKEQQKQIEKLTDEVRELKKR